MKRPAWLVPPLALVLAFTSLYLPPSFAHYSLLDLTIPLLGLAGGSTLFFWLLQRSDRDLQSQFERPGPQNQLWPILLLFLASFGLFGFLSLLRYITRHSAIFDLGIYDQKVWLIAQQPSWAQAWRTSVSGHFQPVLLLYAGLYQLWPSPVVLLICQSLTIASGVIPLYLLAVLHLRSRPVGLLMAGIYLLYPAVEFNALFDFHPDHLAIPLMLWAFYLADRHCVVGALCLAGVTALLKEPFFLTASFFGLYLALSHRRYLLGLGSFALGLLLFYGIVFWSGKEGGAILESPAYRYLGESPAEAITTLFRNPLALPQKVLQRHKLAYLYFHFAPLGFIPLLAPLPLLPALPGFLVSLLSAARLHADPTSHYSAGAIAPIFIALLYGISWLQRKADPLPLTMPLLSGLLILGLAFNVAKSPSPISLYSWSTDQAQNWTRWSYRFEKRAALLKAESLIPSDPNIVVVSQNNLNSARLAHRYTYHVFPYKSDEADYIVLDTGRPHYVFDHFDETLYSRNLRRLQEDPEVRLIFAEDGILVFKRSKEGRSELTQH